MTASTSTTDETTDSNGGELVIGNYCAAFIDLLGQRVALQNQSLLPVPTSEEEHSALHRTIRSSIGAIAVLQREAELILAGVARSDQTGLRGTLDTKDQALWDEMSASRVLKQRWSDGLLYFSCLGDKQVKCHMNNVFQMFVLTGAHCFLGLARGQPVRGAMEVSWGIELHPGELYGAAVANAYQLESEVAGYPRIVIGEHLLKFIDAHFFNTATDPFAGCDRELAHLCRDMIIVDGDGCKILNYLSPTFQMITSDQFHGDLYDRAKRFVHSQLRFHQERKNSKLAFRYLQLVSFFEEFPPDGSAR